jgi:hypothetical protein
MLQNVFQEGFGKKKWQNTLVIVLDVEGVL